METRSGASPVPSARQESSKAGILIVDDREENLKALAAVLGDLGDPVLLAATGQDALRIAYTHDLAVILLDVRMPGMNGIETAEWIRSRKRSRFVPIIFLTAADARPDEIARAYAAGAVDYIFKPFAPEVLKAKVRSFLELHRKNEELHESERRYQTLAEISPVGIFRTSARGECLYVNTRLCEITGLSADDIRGAGWIPSVHPDDRERVAAEWAQASRDGKPFTQEYRFLRKNGEVLWVLGHATPEGPKPGEPAGFIGTMTKITKRKLAEEQLEQSKAALQLSYKELETFSYTVSHDLRAPLRSMHRFADLLLDEFGATLGPDGQEYAKRIAQAAGQMDVLIQDLLAYSQLGKREVRLEAVQLGAVLAEVLRQLEGDIAASRAEILVAEPLPAITGEPVLVAQILVNLISNAIKFVAPGVRPRIRIGADDSREDIRLWIEDNGIGISGEYHPKLFRVFERLVRGSDYPGTGIGLAIVRRAVERLGGRVGLESGEGQGSRFWVEFLRVEKGHE